MGNLRGVIFFLLFLFLAGCAAGGFDSIRKTTQLQAGMSYDEAVALLGPPKTTVMQGGKRISTFWLHQAYRGNVPMDLVFDPQTNRLVSWQENAEKFAASQAKLAAFTQALEQSGAAGGAAPAGPNDPNLQRQMAGLWWGYAGSTERQIGLCADGAYHDSAESSYSGHSNNQYGDETMAWGSASQGGGQGRWTINGNAQSGTIHVTYSNGNRSEIRYRSINDPGCLSFDGNTLCKKSAQCR